ncbi:ABC uptake transporter, ATP-binding protein [Candidatus Nitrososphaera gargensis Ga9.2]|uniref:ABC uptake transporter, ATP-binding protein n=1 Tax=Nitrososphaera gargensis (strain Ga9.2) TaxID=1237085 RepID=K0IDT6_NITGG|nr:metal ABC transporter ATP-binding protein [Candidatus Nitrososphaera gargensis]AFU56978.1 ABC uptake transporter, ATP-binding protein [Candidatus Nitrososphaera gargensis Ga9.2]
MQTTTVVVEIDKLSYAYSGSLVVLDNISFSINEGVLLGMIDPNGAGKTTLFSCMLGLLGDYTGTIKIFGRDIRKDSKEALKSIGYIPQKKTIDQNFPATVEEIVSLGITTGNKISKDKIGSALDTVGLLAQKDRRVSKLSGGQQRVLIAKAIVNDPKLLILDEPATGIDLETQNKFYALLKKLNQEKKITIIWASHDLDAVNRIASSVACVNRSMFFHGKIHEFFENADLLKAYSESSMQAHMHMHDHHHDQHDHGAR